MTAILDGTLASTTDYHVEQFSLSPTLGSALIVKQIGDRLGLARWIPYRYAEIL